MRDGVPIREGVPGPLGSTSGEAGFDPPPSLLGEEQPGMPDSELVGGARGLS